MKCAWSGGVGSYNPDWSRLEKGQVESSELDNLMQMWHLTRCKTGAQENKHNFLISYTAAGEQLVTCYPLFRY